MKACIFLTTSLRNLSRFRLQTEQAYTTTNPAIPFRQQIKSSQKNARWEPKGFQMSICINMRTQILYL